ncbi:hypothetical protein DRE_03447 [Drechslerella stenobrocha 248]|uniref:RRM domain-containing protein n=1 Tax=Drechslerella stenobrocha 248 TaxID=1043628 RepID=W7I4K0_9PEZI|nr:hypothetical protein DRE_03447 [Drechslerella stenobrocha 248]
MSDNVTIHVSNISPKTTEKDIRAFFSFCGKIAEFSVTPTSKDIDAPLSATISFEQPSAAKTALLLDNTQLSGVPIYVSAAASLSDLQNEAEAAGTSAHDEGVPRQEDKPRTAILAEYLAHGYVIGDKVLQRGIEFDEKNGISSRFRKFLADIDDRHKVSDKSRAMDDTYGISKGATQGYNTVARYLDTALTTPVGQKVHAFYETTVKEVQDIHNEALRLKSLKEGAAEGSTTETPADAAAAPDAPVASTSTPAEKVVYQ